MYSFTKREQVVILVVVFLLILGVFFKFQFLDKVNAKKHELEITSQDNDLDLKYDLQEKEEVQEVISDVNIMVHISGEVYKPGLVELRLGQRLKDAVEYAGGLKKDADIDRINLAKKLVDEDKIYIPKIGEENDDIIDMSIESFQGDNENSTAKININNCSKEALISLPGIGEVTAEKILKYRKENKFNQIEDIKNVSGIGEKKFEAIKDLIATN